MDLRLQPKPEIEILPANKGIVSRKEFFAKKKFEEINQYFFAAHFVREWKPKAELIYPTVPDEAQIQYEYDFNRDVQNCFVEDYAEEVFLRTPPPCFVVFGKFKKDVNKLCEKLTNEYGSVLIQVEDIVNQVINTNTETAKILDKILRLGLSLTLNFILALLSFKAHTPEARHRGYVLSGVPSLPLSYDLSVEQQFHYLFTWENKPTVFINVLFDDEDLIKERTNLRILFEGAGNEKSFTFNSLYQYIPDDQDESDIDDEMLPIKEDPPPFESNVNISPSRPWAQLPRDEESRAWYEFEQYDNIIRPFIELIKSRVDPQYFITIDSRVHNEFEVVQARLRLLQIWKAPTAIPFILPRQKDELLGEDDEEEVAEEEGEESEEDALIKQIADNPPQDGFLTLFTTKTLSPKFRWELSHYNYICPVSLREGELLEGKTRFAVGFMKYIYFLRDQQAMDKFMQNPRAYVLPIRPKPLCRFIVIGYPFSGKTSLAADLAVEFSVPLINVNKILENDLMRKRDTYREFCRQKAEYREIIRLTALAWQDWRTEEEKRITLIEDWILFIKTLLSKRIEQFYGSGSVDETPVPFESGKFLLPDVSFDNIEMMGEGSVRSGESTRLQEEEKKSTGVKENSIDVPRPSEKLIQAVKQKDFDISKDGMATEANAFCSKLWDSFSEERCMERHNRMVEEYGEDMFEFDENSESSREVDWCNLLPPQSLSSFLMSKIPYTTREKRQSFKIFLEAASKVYWAPSALKSQFAKWRLPCFMDIPLCQMFLDNPILLLRYLPEWLKERPLIPEPIDPMHPSVIEASNRAFIRAQVVNIKQTQEEVGILLQHAIEKAEREGMRVTGEVVSPGGWVVDNMSLDLKVWNKLACESVFADHIYVLIDTEPDYKRILKNWWERCGMENFSDEVLLGTTENSSEYDKNTRSFRSEGSEEESKNVTLGELSARKRDSDDIITLLIENVKLIQEGNQELDNIYDSIINDSIALPAYFLPILISVFGSHSGKEKIEAHYDFKMDLSLDDTLSIRSLSDTFLSTALLKTSRKYFPSYWNIPLGSSLETVTSALLNYFKKKPVEDTEKEKMKKYFECGLEFFMNLLTLPKKLEEIKNWLSSLNRVSTIHEIEITGKTPEVVLSEIRDNLMEPFIKKPRELENFEIEEIRNASEDMIVSKEEEFEGESARVELSTEEDIRIFGESGQLCVVNLERDIYLLGKLEHALRYYGKLYYFWNEDAKQKFIENPEKYAPYYSAIRCYPPLRIFVTGTFGSGKTTVARFLSRQCGIPMVGYPALLFRNLVPHCDFSSLHVLTNQNLLLSDDHNSTAKLLLEQFLKAPYLTRQFWFEHPLYSDFIDKKILLDKIMEVQKHSVTQNFPELTYACIESISEEKLQEEESLQMPKFESPMPQTPYESMKEIEELIMNYFKNNGDISDYCIEKSLKTLWNIEPYTTQGFVLDRFPMRSSDAKAIIENNWIPDLVVELMVPESMVIERNINTLMELWEAKLKREAIEEKLLEDTVTNFYRTEAFIRKMSSNRERHHDVENGEKLYSSESQPEKSGKSASNIRSPSSTKSKRKSQDYSVTRFKIENEYIQTDNTEAELGYNLNNDLPALIFHPNFETYDAGKARIIENIIKEYRKDSEEIEKLKASLKEIMVPWLEIDGLKSLKEILTDLFIRVDKIRKRLPYKREFAFTLSMEMAEELLKRGYYFLSKFGRWCPVQVYRMKNPIHMFRPFSVRGKVTAIAYRNYIYFVAGENEKTLFLEDPIKYTFNEPHHPNIPLRVAVIGPPKSGKTTLSTRLGIMFDLKVITMGSALRFALEQTPESTFASSVNNYLKRGCFLPLSLKLEALIICLNNPSCCTQGFVLDGIPFDAALTQSLAEKGKLPFVIISLVADPYLGKVNRQKLDLKEFRLPYKNRINLDARYRDWDETYKRFVQWNQDTYNNLYEVNAKLNVVDIFYQAYDIIRKSFFDILYYVEYCLSNRVLPLKYLCVSQPEFELRKSEALGNCPVCWTEEKKLIISVDSSIQSGLVQYGKHFYWICPKHFEQFVKHPKIYFPPYASKWPEILPKRLKSNALETDPQMKIHGYGRCPVTRVDFPNSLDWEGSWNFAAFYRDEAFLCKNEEMLSRFMAEPWNYYKADTKFEVNREGKSSAVENLGPPKVTSLPPIGFLEQTVADLIHESLQLLGSVRPIYPDLSPAVTGCTFVALYLKVYNKKKKATSLDVYYLNLMSQSCRAFKYVVTNVRPTEKEIGQGDFEVEISDESDNSTEDTESISQCPSSAVVSCRHFGDFGKTEKKMWSAKKLPEDRFGMKLTLEDELQEITVHPKELAVLRFEASNLRTVPIPPVSNCVNFIYSISPPVKVPEKFDYRTLYQDTESYFYSVNTKILFNPDKKFAMPLYYSDSKTYESNPNIIKGPRFVSDISLREFKRRSLNEDDYLKEYFIPRFRIYDKIPLLKPPSVPVVVPDMPLVYNPQRDYAYTMLLSEFFCTTHVLRCFGWESNHQLEIGKRLDDNLGLTTTRVEYFYQPRVTRSEESRTSLDSYLQLFDAANFFVVGATKSDLSVGDSTMASSRPSVYEFIQTLLLEKLNHLFEHVFSQNISFDTYEISLASNMEHRSVVIREILPFPPLAWDIVSRPYNAYLSIFSLFQKPMLDNIAHERNFSLLDGIMEQNSTFKYFKVPESMRDPQQMEKIQTFEKDEKETKKRKHYFVFDFFNMPWSSFLTYAHSRVYNEEITKCFNE